MKYLNMSDPSDRLQLQKEIEKPSTGNTVRTVEVYPNMAPDKVLETRSELPPEAILVAVGDSHPMQQTTPKTSNPKRSTGGKMGKEWS